jgi:hypothetical protein
MEVTPPLVIPWLDPLNVAALPPLQYKLINYANTITGRQSRGLKPPLKYKPPKVLKSDTAMFNARKGIR